MYLTAWTTLFLDWVKKKKYIYWTYNTAVFGTDCCFGRFQSLILQGTKYFESEYSSLEKSKPFWADPDPSVSSSYLIISFQYCCRDLLHMKWYLPHKRMICQLRVPVCVCSKWLLNLPGGIVHRSQTSRAPHPQRGSSRSEKLPFKLKAIWWFPSLLLK